MLFEQTKPFENLTTIEPAEKTQITSSKMSVTKYLFSELFNRERSVFPKPRTNTFKGSEVFLFSVRAFRSPIVTSAVPSRCRADQLPGRSRGAGWAAGSAPGRGLSRAGPRLRQRATPQESAPRTFSCSPLKIPQDFEPRERHGVNLLIK